METKKKNFTHFDVPPLTAEQVKNISVQTPNMPVFYFNHSRIASSNFDLRIYFGQGNITAKGEQSLVEQICVILAPEFAATFVETLKFTLERFEARFGKIRSAPISLPKVEEAEPAKVTKRKKVN